MKVDSKIVTVKNYEEKHKSRLVRKTFAGFAINVLLYLFLYIGQIIIIRGLSRSEYSTFVIALSFISLTALFADLGLTSLFIKMFAESEEQAAMGKEDQRGKILGTLLIFRGVMCIIIATFIYFVPPFLGYDEQTCSAMKILIVIFFISSRLLTLRNVGESFAMGRGKYTLSSSFALVDSFIFAGVLFFWTSKGLTISTAIWIYALSNLPGFFLLAVTILRWSAKESIRVRFSFSILSKIFRHALPLILGTAFLTIFNNLDPLLLDKWSNSFQVSAFGASLRVMTALAVLPMVLVNIIAPEVARRLVREDHTETHGMVDKVLRALLCLAGAIALIISSSSQGITILILGKGYADASPLIIYLGWLFIPLAFSTVVVEIGIAGGSLWSSTIFRFLLMSFTLIGDILLIKAYGAEGVLIARTIALTIGSVSLLWLMKKFVAINEKLFFSFLARFLFCLAVSAILIMILSKIKTPEILAAFCVLATYIVLIAASKAITKRDVTVVWHGLLNKLH